MSDARITVSNKVQTVPELTADKDIDGPYQQENSVTFLYRHAGRLVG